MHRLVSPVRIAFAGCVAAALAATPAGASIVRDFDSDTVGQPLSGTAYSVLTADTSFEIVSKEFTGGPTSQALRIRDENASGSARFGLRSFDENGDNEGLTKGTLSLTFENTPGTELRVALASAYDGASKLVGFSQRAFLLTFAPGKRIGNIGGSSYPAPTLDQLDIAADTEYQLEIQFDTEAKTWSGTLNGVAITSGGSASIPFNSSLVSAIHIIEFGTTNATTGDIFIDNLNLSVPEPASAALVGLGVFLVAGRARRAVSH